MLSNITRLLVFVALLIVLWGAGILESAHDLLYNSFMFVIQAVYNALLASLSYVGF